MPHDVIAPNGCRPEQLFGLWLIDPATLDAYRGRALAVDLEALARLNAQAEAKREAEGKADKPYAVAGGVAVIAVSGPTTKHQTSFASLLGGTSTVAVGRALSQAADDADVSSILMHFEDAPGGTVAGAFELVDRIRAASRRKPVHAQGTDQMTSAAYLFASVCDRVTVNRTAMVGSIGTRAQLVDTSEAMRRDGIRVIPIAAGKYKAAGLPGTPITDEQVADFQRQVEALNDQFVNDVAIGRGLDPAAVRATEARVYVGAEAVAAGLADSIGTFDETFARLRREHLATSAGGAAPAAASLSLTGDPDVFLLNQLRDLFNDQTLNERQAVDRVRALLGNGDRSTASARPLGKGAVRAADAFSPDASEQFGREWREQQLKARGIDPAA
ncbi:MAG TPA: S49 family peptidase [Tepidisphaeraceae bacterium]|nr:S49 family peptidase [Tepidisphaeraceae bacterium]